MSERHAVIKVNETVVTKVLSKGFSQGFALSPDLWNVSYDELLTIETLEDCAIKGCCDDTKILIYGNDLKTIETKANKVLKDIFDSDQKVKLKFNASKTTALLIT